MGNVQETHSQDFEMPWVTFQQTLLSMLQGYGEKCGESFRLEAFFFQSTQS